MAYMGVRKRCGVAAVAFGIMHTGSFAAAMRAGLSIPLWGEGITAALESGRAAGEAIAAYLRGNNKALPDYSKWVSQHFAARYAETAERRSLAALTGIEPVLS